jgi:hypothetical protein
MYPRRHIMEDILSELADSIESMPSDEEMARLRTLCVEMVEKQREADETEAKLKDLKREIYELQHKKIPEVSAEIGMDRVGLPDLNVDVVVAPYYKANISSSWDEDRRQAAFDYLTEIEVGDIIRTEVSYSLGPESMELAEAIHTAVVEYASRMNDPQNVPEPKIGMGVPWNTLTSVVRELTEKGEPLDLEKIGATVGQVAKIKERK